LAFFCCITIVRTGPLLCRRSRTQWCVWRASRLLRWRTDTSDSNGRSRRP